MPGVLFDNVEKRGYRTSGQPGSEPSGNGNKTHFSDRLAETTPLIDLGCQNKLPARPLWA